jgi:membrane-associated phospholipid phosphatase
MKQWWIALGSACGFIALAASVRLGLPNSLDVIIRGWARPHDVWGTAQLWADLVVEGLRPSVLAMVLAIFTLAFSVKRRSTRPAALVGGICLATLAVTLAAKVAIGRLNPHGVLGNDQGSFPSGHIVAVVVCLGLCLLVAQPRLAKWMWLIPALGAALMAAALLATAVLATVTASGASRWLHDQSQNDHEAAESRPEPQLHSLTPMSASGIDSRAI